MVENKLRSLRAEARVTQATLAEMMPDDVGKVGFCFIEAGKVLPTKAGLRALCDYFNCKPEHIYPCEAELDLSGAIEREDQAVTANRSKLLAAAGSEPDDADGDADREDHKGQEQLRVWMEIEEKAALVKAIKGLGYKSLAEWLREMYRDTLSRYLALKLSKISIHEAVTSSSDQAI